VIAFVEGVVEEVRDGSLVVRAGAWGVEARVPKATLTRRRAGEVVRLHTHLAVREDGWVLYGFDEPDALRVFQLLIGISGVGPKLALAVLSSLPLQVIATAVVEDDPALLAAAPGVGARTAERIVLDLKSRMPEDLLVPRAGGGAPRSALGPEGEDAVAALVALGYREASVKATVAELAGDAPDADAETLIRKALAKLR
jgi:Holliday junction DNA helicase RuvA